MLCRKKNLKKNLYSMKTTFFFLKIKMLYNINTTFKKKEKFNVLQHKWKNSGSDDGCDDIIYLSINPKDDMKLFCGFTQNST